MNGTIYVAGAGMAGLAAATAAVGRGRRVVLLEMARAAGGRCRSFMDRRLGRRIDNGNHLVLSGNRSLVGFLRRIDAVDRMVELAPAAFPFVDLATGTRWVVRPNPGRFPWWALRADRRPAGSHAVGLLRDLGRLLAAGPSRSVAEVLDAADPTFARFWDPLAVGVLNTPSNRASARLLRPVLLETFAKGEAYCRPLLARACLGDALVDPAVGWLRGQGGTVVFGAEVEALDLAGGRLRAFRASGVWHHLDTRDGLVLATPPWATVALVPGLTAPTAYGAIVNAHFLLPRPPQPRPSLLGVTGGLCQWIFTRGDVAAVTISAAGSAADLPSEALAAKLWPEVRAALALPVGAAPRQHRIVKERRATPEQTPAAARERWPQRTAWANLVLAGDWTATGLPATIEGAVRSGERAVHLLCDHHSLATQHADEFAAVSA